MLSHIANDYDKKRDKDIADGTYKPVELSESTKKVAYKGLKVIKWIGIFILVWFIIISLMALAASAGGGY